MRALTELEYQVEAEPILRKVFVNDNPFDRPFSPSITARRMIYPCECYVDQPLIDAVIAAAASSGDTGCYLSLLWKHSAHPNHCYIPFSEFSEAYNGTEENGRLVAVQLGLEVNLENVLYSSQGKWGIFLCQERYGLLGGSPEFIEEIRRSVPDLDTQVYGFLQNCRGFFEDLGMKPDLYQIEWLPGLLAHVYGPKKARKLLRDARNS